MLVAAVAFDVSDSLVWQRQLARTDLILVLISALSAQRVPEAVLRGG